MQRLFSTKRNFLMPPRSALQHEVWNARRYPSPNQMCRSISSIRQTVVVDSERTPDSKLRKKILLKNTLKHNKPEKDSSRDQSPVCNLFHIGTDSQDIDGGNKENPSPKDGQSPTEDESSELSMKSVVLSSDEYSSSESETDEHENRWRKRGKVDSPIVGLVRHKPPKPRYIVKSPRAPFHTRGTPGRRGHCMLNSPVPSSEESSSGESSDEDDKVTKEDGKPEEDSEELTGRTGTSPGKKTVRFGGMVDTYWEEHWDKFWKAASENQAVTSTMPTELALDEEVNSQNFSPVVSSTQKDDDNLDGCNSMTTSTPYPMKNGVNGSESSEDFSSLGDSNNSCEESTQNAVLRAIAVLESSDGSQNSSLKMQQSTTQESINSSQPSGSTHTSEWESESMSSGPDTSSSKSSDHHQPLNLTNAQSIEDIAQIMSIWCVREAVGVIMSTKTPLHQGRLYLSPPLAYSPSPLVTIGGYLCDTPAPVMNLSAQLCEQIMGDSYDQSLDDTDGYIRVRGTPSKDQLVPNQTTKSLPYTETADPKTHMDDEMAVQYENMEVVEWNNKFFATVRKDTELGSIKELETFEGEAFTFVVKPQSVATVFTGQLKITDPPFVYQDMTAAANLESSVDIGWCQKTYFSEVSTPTPKRRRRSFFPDLIGEDLHDQPEEISTPKPRFFKSPNAMDLVKEHIPDSCSPSDAVEKLPLIHNLGMSSPILEFKSSATKPFLGECASPVIPVCRGKLSSIIDVLKDSPESGRCSKESDHSDSKSVESTPVSTHGSSSSDGTSLSQDPESNSFEEPPIAVMEYSSDQNKNPLGNSGRTSSNQSGDDLVEEMNSLRRSGSGTSIAEAASDDDVVTFKELEPPISDLESSQSSLPAVADLNPSDGLGDHMSMGRDRLGVHDIPGTYQDSAEDCVSLEAEGTITDRSFSETNDESENQGSDGNEHQDDSIETVGNSEEHLVADSDEMSENVNSYSQDETDEDTSVIDNSQLSDPDDGTADDSRHDSSVHEEDSGETDAEVEEIASESDGDAISEVIESTDGENVDESIGIDDETGDVEEIPSEPDGVVDQEETEDEVEEIASQSDEDVSEAIESTDDDNVDESIGVDEDENDDVVEKITSQSDEDVKEIASESNADEVIESTDDENVDESSGLDEDENDDVVEKITSQSDEDVVSEGTEEDENVDESDLVEEIASDSEAEAVSECIESTDNELLGESGENDSDLDEDLDETADAVEEIVSESDGDVVSDVIAETESQDEPDPVSSELDSVFDHSAEELDEDASEEEEADTDEAIEDALDDPDYTVDQSDVSEYVEESDNSFIILGGEHAVELNGNKRSFHREILLDPYPFSSTSEKEFVNLLNYSKIEDYFRGIDYGEGETACEPEVILTSGVSWAPKLVKWTIYEEDIWVDPNDDTLPYQSPN